MRDYLKPKGRLHTHQASVWEIISTSLVEYLFFIFIFLFNGHIKAQIGLNVSLQQKVYCERGERKVTLFILW